MKNEEEETSLKDVTITFRHSKVEDEFPENFYQLTNEDYFADGNLQPSTSDTKLFRRRTKPAQENTDFYNEICKESWIESTNIEIEEENAQEKGGESIWSSMKSIMSCFYVQKIDDQLRFSHRISNDRLPISRDFSVGSSGSEHYFSRKNIYRRNGEVVKLISINETIYQKFPDEVFGNHSSEMFFWPYLIPWQLMLMTILVISFEIVYYNVLFDRRYLLFPIVNSYSYYMVFWVLQTVYLIDCLLTIVHRQWTEFQIKHTIVARSKHYVALDLIVLLPTFLCSYLREKEKFWVHTIQFFAVHRIFLYARQMSSTLQISRLIVLYITFIFIWLFNIALSSFTIGYSCFPTYEENNWLCGKGYWYKSFSEMEYIQKPQTEFELYALAKLHALLLLPPMCEAEYFQNGSSIIRWMYIFMLTAIYLFSYLFAVPLLARRIFKNDYMWISFSMMRYRVVNSLSEMKFADIAAANVDQFFSYAWRKRRALVVESVTSDVPPELWLSVQHDIFYPAFAHSQLFAKEDHCYLRMLASRMHSVLLMEGDVILRKKELVAKMIYVVEGSVQILTTEDDTTPQLILGAGTIIGETSLLTSYNSKCYICCRSMTCEIHVLEKLDFVEISYLFRKNFHLAMRTVKQRYVNARTLNRLSGMIKAKVKKSLRLEEQLVTATDWLKFKMQLHHDTDASLKSEAYTISGLEDWYIHAHHTLNFLGQLAVPQIGFESVADPVLLKLTFPFIFQPNSRVHQFWNKLMFVSVIFLALYLPYSFSFSCSYTPFMANYPAIYLIIYVLDILLQISTSVQTKRGMSIEVADIIYHLIQQPLFIIDIISTLPLFWFSYVALNEQENLRPLAQLNQLLKIIRIEHYLEDNWTIQTEYQFYWRRLINSDFLRQIIGCLKVLWLQPGDKIVKIRSRNGCMYFVVDGIVVMNNSQGVTVEILEPWGSFGMAQGINPNLGHAFNYIAHSNCCIACLDYNDWNHLAEFHTESMRLIRERIEEINIKMEEQYGASRIY
ncbi:hypothetical protein LSTR_LSTR010539 [Laodelphax striatellus]|uniref:Cyclic nucleotide-binding domain-containing protein n=1 Tax=Laodelphax striatellus TaxID=195883 RepID=A0A482WL27_LAOST|nr:hypothetical protein LSTR_LSTR010539 [Laodelphax striatellus]